MTTLSMARAGSAPRVTDCLRLPVLAGASLSGGRAGLAAPVRWAAASPAVRGCSPGEFRVVRGALDVAGVLAGADAGVAALGAPSVSHAAAEAAEERGVPVLALGGAVSPDRVAADVLDLVVGALDAGLAQTRRLAARLGAAACDDLGVAPVAEVLAAVTGMPVLVEDADGAVLAAVGTAERTGPRRLSVELRSRGEVLGVCTLLVAGKGAPEPGCAFALEQAATLLTVALLHERALRRGGTGAGARSALVLDMLDPAASADVVAARCAQHGVAVDVPRAAVLLEPAEGSAPERLAAAARAALGERDALVGVMGGTVVALLPAPDGVRVAERATWLAEACGAALATVARAAACPGELPDAARSALRVHAAALRAGRRGVVDAGALGVVGLLLDADPEAVARLARPLRPLVEHDARTGSELCRTVEAFLDCGGLRPAARRLGIHPNSLAHRLRRCEEVGGFSLGDRDARLELAVALRCRGTLGAS